MMFKHLLRRFLPAGILSLLCYGLAAQAPGETPGNLFLRKKKKTITIVHGDYIGFTTAKDTVKYFGDKELSYKLFKADTTNFLLRRPLQYRDTIVESGKFDLSKAGEYRYGRAYRKDKKWYANIVLVDSYEYKSVAVKDITTIQYPPDADNTLGCIFCPFVPVYNIFYFISLKKRWRPQNFEMGKWRLVQKSAAI